MEQVLIEKLNNSDFESLVKLYEAVWPTVDYDKRKKANFIVNESNGINYCAKVGETVIGSRTSCPQNMLYGDCPIKTVQIGDSCVHPNYQGRGLFLKMNKAFLQDFFGEGGELIYNISVCASRKAYEKLGWKYIKSLMSLRKFPQPLITLIKIGFKPKRLTIPIKWDKINDSINIDTLLLESREKFFSTNAMLHIKYDEDTFKWRMKSESGIKQYFVEKLGCIIYKEGYRGCIKEAEIGELFLYDYTKKNFKKLLDRFSKWLQPDIITVLVSEGHPLNTWYRSCLFMINLKQKYLHHGVRVESDKMKKIGYNPMNWAISSLDIDTF